MPDNDHFTLNDGPQALLRVDPAESPGGEAFYVQNLTTLQARRFGTYEEA